MYAGELLITYAWYRAAPHKVAVIVSITLNRGVLSFREGNVSKVTSSKNGMQTQVYWTLVLSLDCTRFVVSVKILFIQKCHICLPH